MVKTRLNDLTGKTFGKLTALYRDETRERTTHGYWICKCDYGNITSIRGHCLTHGQK